jgi:hypothetical protein
MVLVKTILKSPLGDVNDRSIGIFSKKQKEMEPPVGHHALRRMPALSVEKVKSSSLFLLRFVSHKKT